MSEHLATVNVKFLCLKMTKTLTYVLLPSPVPAPLLSIAKVYDFASAAAPVLSMRIKVDI